MDAPLADRASLKAAADELFRRQKFEEAIEAYTLCISKDPNNAVLYCNRSAAQLRLGRIDQSLEDASSAAALDPTYAKAYFRLALAYIEKKDVDHASAALATAQKIHPSPDYLPAVQKLLAVLKFTGSTVGSSPSVDTIGMMLYALDKRQHADANLSSSDQHFCLTFVWNTLQSRSLQPSDIQKLLSNHFIDALTQIRKQNPITVPAGDEDWDVDVDDIFTSLAMQYFDLCHEQILSSSLISDYIQSISAHKLPTAVAGSYMSFISLMLQKLPNANLRTLLDQLIQNSKFQSSLVSFCKKNMGNFSKEVLQGFASALNLLKKIALNGSDPTRTFINSQGALEMVKSLERAAHGNTVVQSDFPRMHDPEFEGCKAIYNERINVFRLQTAAYDFLGTLLISPPLRDAIMSSQVGFLAMMSAMKSGYQGSDSNLQRVILQFMTKRFAQFTVPDSQKGGAKPVSQTQVMRVGLMNHLDDMLKVDGANVVLIALKRELAKEKIDAEMIGGYCIVFESMCKLLPKELKVDESPFLDIPSRRLQEAAALMIRLVQSDQFKDDYEIHLRVFSALRHMMRSQPFMAKIAKAIVTEGALTQDFSALSIKEPARTVQSVGSEYSFDVDKVRQDMAQNITRRAYWEPQEMRLRTATMFPGRCTVMQSPSAPCPDFSDDFSQLLPLAERTVEKFGKEKAGRICAPISDMLCQIARCASASCNVGQVLYSLLYSKCILLLINTVESSLSSAKSEFGTQYSQTPEARMMKLFCQIVDRLNVQNSESRKLLEESQVGCFLQSHKINIPSSASYSKLRTAVLKSLQKIGISS